MSMASCSTLQRVNRYRNIFSLQQLHNIQLSEPNFLNPFSFFSYTVGQMKGRDSNLGLIIGSTAAVVVALVIVVSLMTQLEKRRKRRKRAQTDMGEVSQIHFLKYGCRLSYKIYKILFNLLYYIIEYT